MKRDHGGDRHEYILKEMYTPPIDESQQKDLVDLVFVHGLGGNLQTTWKVEGTLEPWFTKPEYLGALKDSVRCLSFGYNAERFGDVANTRIIHHANSLLRNLALKRLDDPHRPIIFIAHSLGGLVVKRAILLCSTKNDWAEIKDATSSIIFMGTPHMGSERASDLMVVQRLASFIQFQSPVATNLTKELETFSTAVDDINMQFTIDVHRSIELLCCYESRPQKLVGGFKEEIIVPQWSAVLQGVDNIDLNCHHSGLPKFSSHKESRFELFWGEVERLVRKATPAPKKLTDVPNGAEETSDGTSTSCARQVGSSRRRQSVASTIRSGKQEILEGVPGRIEGVPNHVEAGKCPPRESTVSMKSGYQVEAIDPADFADYIRQLRIVSPENRGFDRELPHWQTCQWILTDPKFEVWKNSKHGGLLFITGSPGCGKSTLAKYIQNVMDQPSGEEAEQTLVIPFYCDSLESSRANPPILDLVVQSLLNKRRIMSKAVREKLEGMLGKADRQKTQELFGNDPHKRFNHLMEVVQTLVLDQHGIPSCLIIDGLDQCEDNFILRLLRGLDGMFRREGATSKLRVLITSRIADTIRGFALSNAHVEITPEIVEGDIQRVVDEEVGRIIVSRQIATIDVTSVSAVIVERSNGSFLFATSVLKELWHIKDTGANSVFTLVTSCPSTMEAIYQQDMNRLEMERPDLFQLVQILSIARRVIRTPEAREILRMQNLEITENYDLIGDLTRMCQRLVKIGSEDTLELLHQTLYDYITNTYDVGLMHQTFAGVCLRFLSAIDWNEISEYELQSRSLKRPGDRIHARFPLLDYASAWMGMHWRHAGTAAIPNVWELWEFLSSEKGKRWILYSTQKRRPVSPQPSSSITTPTILSNSTSAAPLAFSSIGNNAKLNIQNRALEFTLNDAPDDEDECAYLSDTESSMSSSGADWPPSLEQDFPKPPLFILVQWDVSLIIKELFFVALDSAPRRLFHNFLSLIPYFAPRSTGVGLSKFKVMTNEVWDETTAAHYAAAQFGNALEVMLPYVEDINCKDDDGSTPLNLAARSGEIKGVSLLVEAGADVNVADKWNQTPLFSALQSNSVEVVAYLLRHGADPNIVTHNGMSPLEIVIRKNYAELARVLLDYFPDVKALMTTGQPPAFLASRMGSDAVLELLLPHVDVDEVWDDERIIHDACWRGLEGVVKKLIDLGSNVNDPPPKTPKATPVALAVEGGHNPVLKALIVAGAQVECPLPKMSGPLHIAAARGNLEACKSLVRAGCDVEAESEEHRTALYVAADRNWPRVVEFLLSHGADPNQPEHEPPLVVAVDIGNLEMVQVLLASRIYTEVDTRGDSLDTPLGLAASLGDLEIVSCLLDHGADPNLRSGKWPSNKPLQLASRSKRDKVMIELLRRGADIYPDHLAEFSSFHMACLDGFVDVVLVFLEEVGNVYELVNFDWGWYGSPLLQAAKAGKLEVVKLLLKHCANPDYKLKTKINNGKAIMHSAAESGNIEVLEAIRAKAKDPSLELPDSKGRTPLYYACFEGRIEMVNYLLEQGVKSDVVLTTGENYTMAIVEGGSWDVLERILEKNPTMDIDIPGRDGRTPLLCAVMHGRDKIIRALLKRGADVNRRSRNGEFPLSEAIRCRKKSSLAVLLEHEETDLTQVDVYGRTILQIAQQAGTRTMPRMVLEAAKTTEIESFLCSHPNMLGYNANDYTRIELKHKLDWVRSIGRVRKEAQGLLDDLRPNGPQWERLGKLCLQLSAYSFAQVAFQRSVEVVETTPLFLEHQVQCRLCLEPISGVRYTCNTCCNTDLCSSCVGRYPKMGYCMWTCRNHSFYLVRLPEPTKVRPRRPDALSELSNFADTRLPPLSPITEMPDDEDYFTPKQLLPPTEIIEEPLENVPSARKLPIGSRDYVGVENGQDEPELTASPMDRSDFGVPPDELQRVLADPCYGDQNEKRGAGSELAMNSSDAKIDYVELTDEKLRKFLEAVLTTFTIERTPESLVKWTFDVDSWRLDYDMRVQVIGEDDETPHLLHAPRELKYAAPESEAYEFLAPLAYLFANVPIRHVMTGLPFKAYEHRAIRKKQQVQKIISEAIISARRFEDMDENIDE